MYAGDHYTTGSNTVKIISLIIYTFERHEQCKRCMVNWNGTIIIIM